MNLEEDKEDIYEYVDIIMKMLYYIDMNRCDKVKELLERDGKLPDSATKFIKDFLCDVYEEEPDNKKLEEIIGDEYAKRFMEKI